MTNRYLKCRKYSQEICEPLTVEDYVPQPIASVSPPKWHLAHTTWFFEQFILVPYSSKYEVFSTNFSYLFNSYYNNIGERVKRNQRGFLTRPTVNEVKDYRAYVDKHMVDLLQDESVEIKKLTELGINHEQQHQELLLYDIKYILGSQPLKPKYGARYEIQTEDKTEQWIDIEEGVYEIGTNLNKEFSYDNESPKYRVFLESYSIRNKLVTNGEYLAFIKDGGYEDFNLWHDEGWHFIKENSIKKPLYWEKKNGIWYNYMLNGLEAVDMNNPVQHISFYEASAFAEWQGNRLPTEQEWEVASEKFNYGQLWEWTNSAYLPYPGYKKASGAIGEYNGKFMINQHVLRGASIATPIGHSRPTYRNFYHPESRWIFNGIRLAK